jgi:acetyl-CoA acetyltransferase family protein
VSREVWVIDAVRTPIGRYGGRLAGVRPDDLAAVVIRAIVERTGIAPGSIDDVHFGAANQSGEDNRNVARMAALLAGLPVEVPGLTVNRLCGSSLSAINAAAHAIAFGEADVAIAGGVESMTRAPYVLPKSDAPFGRKQHLFDTVLGWRMVNPKMPPQWTISLGETAEKVAQRYGITREEQDRFAFESQMKCKAAIVRGAFDDEIVVVPLSSPHDGEAALVHDEHPRPETTLDTLAALKPAFKPDGSVTAGNQRRRRRSVALRSGNCKASRIDADGAFCRRRIGRRRARRDGPWPHSGDTQGAEPYRSFVVAARSRRNQRGVRGPSDRVHARSTTRPRNHQR